MTENLSPLYSLAGDVVAEAKLKRKVLTTAESCTGGLIAGAITSIPGASDIYKEGYVTYSNVAKTKLLGVLPKILDTHGAVSLETAYAMAEGALKHANADIAISVTGIAGPAGGTALKPVGMVCFGLSFKGTDGEPQTMSHVHYFEDKGRHYIREESVHLALKWVYDHLKTLDLPA
ncbi:CinA family protein [Asticcacaulis sp. SL142]|uniref:CinA family protein n=1 Tax=Asticcacaulis sp. SL142 TaxID=2995155 RepID=UPI00226CF571|nr:CinA family protein [Asticcacaulis sp. SL142]WAC48924.1 CinA family protein [Asticcacaulis sp. SL142]